MDYRDDSRPMVELMLRRRKSHASLDPTRSSWIGESPEGAKQENDETG